MNAKQRRRELRKLKSKAARPEQLVALRLEGANQMAIAEWVVKHQAGKTNVVNWKLYSYICKQLGVAL